jgi:hypothetical protein
MKGLIMPEEKIEISSGKEITVHISDEGEPEKVSWEGASELTESEVFDLESFLSDYGNDDSE